MVKIFSFKTKKNGSINKNQLSEKNVMPIIRYHEEKLCFVMPLGDRSLDEIIRHEAIAGVNIKQIRKIMESIALCLHHLHEDNGIIHGDINSQNILRHKGEIKLIDFDQSVSINKYFHPKRSTGNTAPELARKIFLEKKEKKTSSTMTQQKTKWI